MIDYSSFRWFYNGKVRGYSIFCRLPMEEGLAPKLVTVSLMAFEGRALSHAILGGWDGRGGGRGGGQKGSAGGWGGIRGEEEAEES